MRSELSFNSVDFSIIVPVYNSDLTLLRRTINSIHNTFKGGSSTYEIILVDDGSTLNSQHYKKLSETFGLVYAKHERNLSLFQARLTGIRLSKGKYVLSVDSDDCLRNMNWERIKEIFSTENVEILMFSVKEGVSLHLAESSSCFSLRAGKYSGTCDVFNLFCSGVNWSMAGKVFSRKFLQAFLNNWSILDGKYINLCEDFCYTTSMFMFVESFIVCEDVGEYFYYQNPKSMTKTTWSSQPDKIKQYLEQLIDIKRLVNDALELSSNTNEERIQKLSLLLKLYQMLFERIYPLVSTITSKNNELAVMLREAFPEESFKRGIINLSKKKNEIGIEEPNWCMKIINLILPPFTIRRVLVKRLYIRVKSFLCCHLSQR